MSLGNKVHSRPYFDVRLKLFGLFKKLLILAILLFIIKYFFIDTFSIKSDILSPYIQKGDRVLISRIASRFPFNLFLSPSYGERVLFSYPMRSTLGIIRIMGKPGDTISIKDCEIFSSYKDENKANLFTPLIKKEPLSGEYSPRDNMSQYVVPQKGDTLVPPSMTIRDLIYSYSLISHEQKSKQIVLKRKLFIGDSLKNDYLIKEFYRYSGKFIDIPDSLNNDYLFWEQLESYLNKTVDKENPSIQLTIETSSGEKYTRYAIKENYYFLISDNWDRGLDSRYFGPIASSEIKGRVFMVLWSIAQDDKNIFKKLRIRRLLKFIGKQGIQWQK